MPIESTPHNALQAYDDVLGRMILHRQADHRPMLIVEGKSDRIFLGQVLEHVIIFQAGTRKQVLALLQGVSQARVSGVLGIVDLDFELDHEDVRSRRDVHPYLGADLESMLIQLGALFPVVEDRASDVKLDAVGGAPKFVNELVEKLKPITHLRWLNTTHGWGINFNDLNFERIFDKKDLACDQSRLHGQVEKMLPPEVLAGDWKSVVMDAKEPVDGRYRGKDLLRLLSLAFRRKIATLRSGAEPDDLASSLRAAGVLFTLRSEWFSRLSEIVGTPNGVS